MPDLPPANFTYTRRVQFAETDMAGIVHFSNYYRYMEEAEHAFFRTLGLKLMQTLDDGTVIGWPRVRSACQYIAPMRYDDEVSIELRLERVGVRSLQLNFQFLRGETLIARGDLKTVCCYCRHEQPLESCDIPANYREKFERAAAAPV